MFSILRPNLHHNFRLMFFIQALTEIKAINVISTIFYLHRGLSLSQVFYLSIAFAVVSILTEVPSSYLADKWSRKKLIILSLIIGAIYWSINLFANSFILFIVAISTYALANSIMSGTDEALVYDTAKELGQESNSLKKLGQFYSSQRIFKILTPLLTVVLAQNLQEWQFYLIISIDIVANLIAIILASALAEPNHHLSVEKIESGIMLDALNLFKRNPVLLRIILSRSLIFIVGFIVWRIGSDYFNNLGTPLIFIGLAATFNQLSLFLFNINAHRWLEKFTSQQIINRFNLIGFLSLSLFTVNQIFLKNWPIAIISYCFMMISETARWPYFSDLFNKHSSSYNRATTLSLSTLLTSLLQIPFLFLGSVLVTFGYTPLFIMVLVISFVTVVALSVKI